MCSVQCIVCNFQFLAFSVKCGACNVGMFTVQCEVCNVGMFTVQCVVCSVQTMTALIQANSLLNIVIDHNEGLFAVLTK